MITNDKNKTLLFGDTLHVESDLFRPHPLLWKLLNVL